MNPNSGEIQPNFEFQTPPETDNTSPISPEKGVVSRPENRPQKQSVQASSQAASDLALPASTTVAKTNSTTDDDTTDKPSSKEAKDTDRIEQVWIDKAKAVVAKTQDDPFEQKNAMSRVKAEYIKTRFNKTLRTDETRT